MARGGGRWRGGRRARAAPCGPARPAQGERPGGPRRRRRRREGTRRGGFCPGRLLVPPPPLPPEPPARARRRFRLPQGPGGWRLPAPLARDLQRPLVAGEPPPVGIPNHQGITSPGCPHPRALPSPRDAVPGLIWGARATLLPRCSVLGCSHPGAGASMAVGRGWPGVFTSRR